MLELASLNRCVGHGVDRFERGIAASFGYNRGIITAAQALHTQMNETSKIALIRTAVSMSSQTTRS